MLLSFDVDVEAVAEHDRWHTQEHLPERLAITGFLRGTRWTAIEGRLAAWSCTRSRTSTC
jgi:hypothetical protein